MSSVPRRLMAPVDASWYRMDRPNNPAVVTGLLLLDGPVDGDTVRTVFAERLLPFERFRFRVVERGWVWSLPTWEADPHFDLDRHLQTRALPPSATKEDLLDVVGTLASKPLHPNRPLWDATVIDWGPQRGALVIRFHHCMADGTGAVALAKQLLDPLPGVPNHRPVDALPSTLPSTSSVLERATDAAIEGVKAGVRRLVHPLDTLSQMPRLVNALITATEDVLQWGDPASPLRADLTGTQRLGYTDPVPLPTVKAIGAPFGATVNDVMVAALSGAIRQILQQKGRTAPYPTLRAIVPVDLRSEDDALQLGNGFGLTFLPLPLNEETPTGRLRAAKREMDEIKQSPEATVFLHILGLFGQLPRAVEDVASSLFASKASMVMTNVAGPSQARRLADHRVEDMIFWVPHPVSLGVGVSILSYGGRMTVGVIADDGLDVNPRTLTRVIEDEFDALRSGTPPRDQPNGAHIVTQETSITTST